MTLSDVLADVHVYGVPNQRPPVPEAITVHAGDGDELRRSWFVVDADCPADRKAALLAAKSVPTSGPARGWTTLP